MNTQRKMLWLTLGIVAWFMENDPLEASLKVIELPRANHSTRGAMKMDAGEASRLRTKSKLAYSHSTPIYDSLGQVTKGWQHDANGVSVSRSTTGQGFP
jgi:hypothetical protein